MWENLLTSTGTLAWEAAKEIGSGIMESSKELASGLVENSEDIANIAGIGAAGYGAYNSHKALKEAKKQSDLSRESYYKNALRQDKEDEAISRAAASVTI